MEKIAYYQLDDEFPAKTVSLCSTDSLTNLSSLIQPSDKYFVLFIALDARGIDDQIIYSAAKELLDRGMVYACVWGPDCERVHDVIDLAIVQRNPDETDGNVVITTWHAKDLLYEAVWFFLNCAWPAEDYVHACADWIAVAIGNLAWGAEVRATLLDEKEESEGA